MAGNQAINSMPTVPTPVGGLLYLVKNLTDYKVEVGGPLGIAYLDSSGMIPASIIEVTWADVSGKPLTFTPSAHVHAAADITSGVLATARLGTGTGSTSTWLRGDGSWNAIDWTAVQSKPATATRWPTFAEVTSRPTTLSGYGITDATPLNGPLNRGTDRITGALTHESGAGYMYIGSYSTSAYGDGRLTVWWNENLKTLNMADAAVLRIQSGEVLTMSTLTAQSVGLATDSTYGYVYGRSATTDTGLILANSGSQAILSSSSLTRLAVGSNTFSLQSSSTTSTVSITAPNFISPSDAKLKDAIKLRQPRNLGDAVEFVSFNWCESGDSDLGVIAQQVAQVAPEYVHEREDGYLAVDKTSLALEIALSASARCKELEARVQELEAQLEAK